MQEIMNIEEEVQFPRTKIIIIIEVVVIAMHLVRTWKSSIPTN
jgi:hypothetical protein